MSFKSSLNIATFYLVLSSSHSILFACGGQKVPFENLRDPIGTFSGEEIRSMIFFEHSLNAIENRRSDGNVEVKAVAAFPAQTYILKAIISGLGDDACPDVVLGGKFLSEALDGNNYPISIDPNALITLLSEFDKLEKEDTGCQLDYSQPLILARIPTISFSKNTTQAFFVTINHIVDNQIVKASATLYNKIDKHERVTWHVDGTRCID